MIKAIFWDNDGVLVDTEHLYFIATRQVLAAVGITLTEEMYVELLLVQGKGAWHLAEEKGISPAEVAQLRDQRNALYLKLVTTETKIINGVEEVLSSLQGKYLMGVVTSSKREHFEAIHKKTGLMKYFTFVLTSEDYGKHKPDPEPYLLAVQKSGFKTEECIAVEDSERGLISATGAGLKCIVIPRGLTRSQKFRGAWRILDDISQLSIELAEIDKSEKRHS